MKILRLFLLPVSWLYGIGIFFRNLLYDFGILKSQGFAVPVISVGNLNVGGTGKTPHTEYLVDLLKEEFEVATLSRGYGRQTTGYVVATTDSDAIAIGDEPRQYKQKFPDVTVAVDEKRVHGIRELINTVPLLSAILLDDAHQHRAVKPGLSIVLTAYHDLYINDHLLPFGRLREGTAGANRADIIIVTKTPELFSPMERRILKENLRAKPYHSVYFSYFQYSDLQPFVTNKTKPISLSKLKSDRYKVMLVTGIAYPGNLVYFLESELGSIEHLEYPDHHRFTPSDLDKILKIFDNIASERKLLLTTEKDAMRLAGTPAAEQLGDLPFYYLPIRVAFHEKDKDAFNEQINDYVRRNQPNSGIH